MVIIVLLAAGVLLWGLSFATSGFFGRSPFGAERHKGAVPQSSFKDIAYIIEGNSVLLVNGLAESGAAPGSASKITTRYFGNEAEGDLNGDGVPDVAFLLTQDAGGSGTFYYAVAALKTATGYRGTNAILLGDRVAPQTTEIRDGKVIVNYAIRKPGEPTTARPSLGVSKYLSVSGSTLVEIR